MSYERWEIWVLVCAVFIRALIAPGVMVAQGDDPSDGLQLIICQSDIAGTIANIDGDPDQPTDQGATASEPCAFSTLPLALAPGEQSIALAAPPTATPELWAAEQLLRQRELRGYSARAPPRSLQV